MNAQQRGFTLVELMVAMLIGLILTLAALQVFLTNQRTFALQQALTELNEDGQLAIRYMVADIRRAGQGDDILGAVEPIWLEQASDGGTGNDTLAIQYWGLDTCTGEQFADLTQVESRYSINNGELQCTSNGQTVGLLTGVESFQVLYGIDTADDGNLGPIQFVNAGSLDADSIVVATRIGLLLSSDRFNQGETTARNYWVLDQQVARNDALLRRVYSSSVQLRNYDWEAVFGCDRNPTSANCTGGAGSP
ncbi:PilW family protein [Thiopseudomonas alkaliphila]|uniref:PilW family protein n=1 Tax=Thiopseudomonas alkaliphila TaxID=1697053 RepID=A0AAW7DRT7_9GAMM|nr:PilW family protein [Thiopseudomonas alkaliphila]MDM1695928.1 PilW family protein [Thiopseudomonas alkaliphila]